MHISPKEVRKLIIAALGVLALALSANLISGTAREVATSILAAATALGVYVVPNVPKV